MTSHIKNISVCIILFFCQIPLLKAQYGPINPFIMPDNDSLNWYGSGDVNNDNVIDWDDLFRFDSLLNGLFSDQYAKRYFDRSDINGD